MKTVPRRVAASKTVDLPAGDTLAFMRVLWALDHALQRTSKRMHAAVGVTGRQRLAIRMLGRFPGLSVNELGMVMHLDPSTLTGVLGRLEKHGLIRRCRDPRDRRRWQLGLTPLGRRVDAHRRGTVEEAVQAMQHDMPQQDVEATYRVLGRLVDRLEAQRADLGRPVKK